MSYSLHIERSPAELTLEEWIEAVKKQEGVKLIEGGSKITNPKTGEVISIPGRPGDVAVLFHSKGFFGFGSESEWHPCISFFGGRASFKAPIDMQSPNDPLRAAVSELAKTLGAKVVGDEGEVFEW